MKHYVIVLMLRDGRKSVNSLEIPIATSLREKNSSIDIKADIGPLTSNEKYWYVIGGDILSFVKEFETMASIPRGCNSSVFSLVPKFDDPIVIGDFRPINLIGCQYKIIAKVLANRLANVISAAAVDSTTSQMEFSNNWMKWIYSCLISAFASVLINGSPTSEFNRQGVDKVHVSHLQFADDELILGDWSKPNIDNLSTILTCFHLASNLKVNSTRVDYMALNKVIFSPKQCGLGIGSLVVSNQALLAKWWWRFLIEDNALWCKFIRSIHGPQRGLHYASLIRSKSGPWYQIAKDLFNDYGINLPFSFKKNIGNVESIRF
ncbi:hypothetical protein Tco_0012534 [Tanacetum coccineum]